MSSVTAVSFTYCAQAFAVASSGSQPAVSGSPVHFDTAAGSPPLIGASHARSIGGAASRSPPFFGRRAVKQASSHRTARYRWLPHS